MPNDKKCKQKFQEISTGFNYRIYISDSAGLINNKEVLILAFPQKRNYTNKGGMLLFLNPGNTVLFRENIREEMLRWSGRRKKYNGSDIMKIQRRERNNGKKRNSFTEKS